MSDIRLNMTAVKLALAFLAAFVIYYFYPTNTAYWSLVTIAAIAQAGFDNTLSKAVMRFLGTITGAILGYLLALLLHAHILWLSAVFFMGVFLSSVVAMQRSNIAYAGVVAGVTMVIVLSSSLLYGQLVENALFRSLEVTIGIVVLLTVNLILILIFRPESHNRKYFTGGFKKAIPDLISFEINKSIVRNACKIALACTFTFGAWRWWQQPEGFWATVTCLLIMEESAHGTKVKASIRIVAHVITAGIGVAWAVLLGNYFWTLLIPLLIGGYYCGYLIGNKDKYSSLGTTMGIALVIMLLVDPGSLSTLHVVFWRFTNVMFGIIIGVLITQYFFSNRTNE